MSREQIIRDTAYAIWEAEGKPEGRHSEHWREAEARVAGSLSGGKTQPAARAAGVAATGADKGKAGARRSAGPAEKTTAATPGAVAKPAVKAPTVKAPAVKT